MPLPAASETMMVTGRLGYCAKLGEASATNSAHAIHLATLRIAILPHRILVGADCCPARWAMSSAAILRRHAPLPVVGRGLGVGVEVCCAAGSTNTDPHPDRCAKRSDRPSPQGGGQ